MGNNQEACFESVKKEMLKQIKSDHECDRVMTPEEYISSALFFTTLYFTDHHLPRALYTQEFVQRKYPELVERIRIMVEEALKATRGL
jgi:hypothetical protein